MNYGRCKHTGKMAMDGICPAHGETGCVVFVPSDLYPMDGWVHATNAAQFREGSLFGWTDENGKLWSGLVVTSDPRALRVKVRDILPGRMSNG